MPNRAPRKNHPTSASPPKKRSLRPNYSNDGRPCSSREETSTRDSSANGDTFSAKVHAQSESRRASQDLGEQRIRDMDATGIARQILSLTNPGVQLFNPAEGAALAISFNDQLAEAIASIPTASPVSPPSRLRIPRLRRRNWNAASESWA